MRRGVDDGIMVTTETTSSRHEQDISTCEVLTDKLQRVAKHLSLLARKTLESTRVFDSNVVLKCRWTVRVRCIHSIVKSYLEVSGRFT